MRSSEGFPGACNIGFYFQGLCEKKSQRRQQGQRRVMCVCLQGVKCDFLAQVYDGLPVSSEAVCCPKSSVSWYPNTAGGLSSCKCLFVSSNGSTRHQSALTGLGSLSKYLNSITCFRIVWKKKKKKERNPRKSEDFWEWWLFAISLQYYMNYLGWLQWSCQVAKHAEWVWSVLGTRTVLKASKKLLLTFI